MRACVRHMAPTHTQLPCARTAVIACEVSKTPRASHPSLGRGEPPWEGGRTSREYADTPAPWDEHQLRPGSAHLHGHIPGQHVPLECKATLSPHWAAGYYKSVRESTGHMPPTGTLALDTSPGDTDVGVCVQWVPGKSHSKPTAP